MTSLKSNIKYIGNNSESTLDSSYENILKILDNYNKHQNNEFDVESVFKSISNGNLRNVLMKLHKHNQINYEIHNDESDKIQKIYDTIDKYFPTIIELIVHTMNGYDTYRVFAIEEKLIYNTPDGNFDIEIDNIAVVKSEIDFCFGRHVVNKIATIYGTYTITNKIIDFDHKNKLIPVNFIKKYLNNKIRSMGLSVLDYDGMMYISWKK